MFQRFVNSVRLLKFGDHGVGGAPAVWEHCPGELYSHGGAFSNGPTQKQENIADLAAKPALISIFSVCYSRTQPIWSRRTGLTQCGAQCR